MKKLILILAAFAVAFMGLSGCTGGRENDNPADNPNGGGGDTDVPSGGGGDDTDEPSGDGGNGSPGVVLTFDSADGVFTDGRESVVVTCGADGAFELPKEPVQDGYAFSGWYIGDNAFNPDTQYSTDATFAARYVSGSTEDVYTALFDINSTVEFSFDMSDAEWKKLNSDYLENAKSPIYRMADSVTVSVTSSGYKLNYYYTEVGVRMKGNTSRRDFYGGNGFFASIHFKLSFGETFDDEDEYTASEIKQWESTADRKARKDRTFATLEKMDLKYNSTQDPTYISDLYALKAFRDNGIAAQNATMCAVKALNCDTSYINLGLYKLYEAVDSIFLERNFEGDSDGDLYKCTYTSSGPADLTRADTNLIGVEDELNNKFYSYDKKTNKKAKTESGALDFSTMVNFINAINANDADYETLIDTEHFARFEAVNYILGNPDCIRNNYNNYYTYFRPSDGKAIFIPFDYDRCLGITKDWNPTGSASMNVAPFTRTVAATGGAQANPLYVNLIDKGAPTNADSVLMLYRNNLINLKNASIFSSHEFDAYKNKYKSTYSSKIKSAISSNAVAFDATNTGNVPFAEYIAGKFRTLEQNINNYNP